MIGGVVMAHAKRKAWAEELSEQLAIPIVWDRVNDRHETGLRCLQAGMDSGSSHWLIVQDDALVCRDLIAALDLAVQVAGERLVGLYAGNTSSRMRTLQATARKAGSAWVERISGETLWGVGIVVPTVHLPSLVEFYTHSKDVNYDRRVEKWADSRSVPIWYTAPSLVEHRTEDNPSLVPGRTSVTRKAAWFIGENESGLDVDWTRVPVTAAHWKHPSNGRVQRALPGSVQANRLQAAGWIPVEPRRCGECGSKYHASVLVERTPA